MTEPSSGIELYESSKFKRYGSSKDKDLAKKRIKKERKKTPKKYKFAEVDLSKEEDYQQVVEVIQNDLIKVHKDAGIEIGNDDFPEVSLLERDKLVEKGMIIADAGEPNALAVGKFDLLLGKTIVLVRGGDELFIDIRSIYHELLHFLGENKLVITKLSKAGKIIVGAGKQGYLTEVISKDKNLSRGNVLDEGVAEGFARKFVMQSDAEIVLEAKRKYADKIWTDFSKKLGLGEKDRQNVDKLCFLGLILNSTESYNQASNIIARITHKAEENKKGGSLRMRNLLIQVRRDGRKTRQLIQEVDELFGKGSGRKLFQTQFKTEEVAQLAKEFN